jgi:hypothetical protein
MIGGRMFFENEIINYYKYNFEIIDVNQYAFQIIIIWTLFKIIFYVFPILTLLHNNEKEHIINSGIKTSNIKKLSIVIIILFIVIPLLDCFVFFYIVVSLIPRVKGLYKKTEVGCQIFGISAGILNLIIISNFQDLIMFSSGIIFIGQSQFFIAFNLSVFSAWALLSAHHLFYIYSLNDALVKLLGNERQLAPREPNSRGTRCNH